MKKQMKFWFVLSVMLFLFVMIMETFGNAPIAAAGDVSSTYRAKCAKCHGSDGRGKTFRGKLTHARDLTEAQWQNDVTDERLFNSISNGRGKMPAFKKQLSESEIDALVAYVRRFKR